MMRVLSILFAASLALFLFACQTDVGLDEHRFQCQTDSDCLDGYVCGEAEKVCQPVGSAEDAGDVPTDTGADADAGQPDAEPDAEPDADAASDSSDADSQCPTGETLADPNGEGEACYIICGGEPDDCADNQECTEHENNLICVDTPPADLDCAGVISCIIECEDPNGECVDDCFLQGSAEAIGPAEDLLICLRDNCPNAQPECTASACDQQLATCANCTSEQVPVTLQCATPCETSQDCAGGEACVQPYFGVSGGQAVCSYEPDNLGVPCDDETACGGLIPGGPDTGQGFCNTDQNPPMCVALGCNPDPQYGLSTGCGLEAVCLEQDTGSGTITSCVPLCREQSDCSSNAIGDTSCLILQNNDEARLGICGPACTRNDDCQFPDSSGASVTGRCNSLSYCERPCSDGGDCNSAGGYCDNDNFCVFEGLQ